MVPDLREERQETLPLSLFSFKPQHVKLNNKQGAEDVSGSAQDESDTITQLSSPSTAHSVYISEHPEGGIPEVTHR